MSKSDDLLKALDVPEPELTWEDRLILNNLFDTQPQRRVAYLKQKGFEMDPKNDNKFRPLGSNGPYVGKIDPGYDEVYQKGGLPAYIKEIGQDAGDLLFDAGVAGLSAVPVIAGALGGGVAGTAAGPAGTVAGGMAGIYQGLAARAIAHATAEQMKKMIGDIVLSEDVPQDYKGTAVQSALAAVLPVALKGAAKLGMSGGKAVLNGIPVSEKAYIEATTESMLNTARRFQKNLTPGLLKQAAQEPEKFSPKASENIGRALNETGREIFGVDPDKITRLNRVNDIKPNSVLGKALAPLNEEAKVIEKQLAQDPSKNITLREILEPFQKIQNDIQNKGRIGQFPKSPTATNTIDESALSQLEKYELQIRKTAYENLKAMGVKNPTPSQIMDAPIDFSQARAFRKTISDGVYDKNVPGGQILKQVAGSAEDQLGGKLSKMAEGTRWNELQSQRYKILDFANNEADNFKGDNIASAFLDDSGTNMAKDRTVQAFEKLDALAGTDYSGKVKDLNFQGEFAKFYRNPDLYEAGNPFFRKAQDVVQGGKSGGIGGAFAAALPEAGVKLKPGENFAQKLSDRFKRLQQLDSRIENSPATKLMNFIENNPASQGAGRVMDSSPGKMAVGLAGNQALSGASNEEEPQQTMVSNVPKFNPDRVNSLLEGL